MRYFTEFGKPALQKMICGGIYASLLHFIVRVQFRREGSSRSLSHLLMSFLFFSERELTFTFAIESSQRRHDAVEHLDGKIRPRTRIVAGCRLQSSHSRSPGFVVVTENHVSYTRLDDNETFGLTTKFADVHSYQ